MQISKLKSHPLSQVYYRQVFHVSAHGSFVLSFAYILSLLLSLMVYIQC